MNWNTFSQCKEELYNEYQIEYNEEVRSELKDGCEAIRLKMIDKPKNLVKAHIFEYILKNAPLQIHPDEIFADCIHHYDLLGDLRTQWQGEIENTVISDIVEKNKAGRKNKAFTAEADFSHTCPGWERILSLGVSGILEEFEKHSASENLTDEQKVFYESGIITYRAVIAYIKRLSQKAKEKTGEKSLFLAKALDNLSANPPQTMHEAKDAIDALSQKGIVNGKGNGKFDPNGIVTRAEFTKMIIGAANLLDQSADCSFNDVADDWSKPYIASAVKHGIVNGMSEADFGSFSSISREQAAVIVYRTLKNLGIDLSGEAASFADEAQSADYAKEAILALSGAKIINGKGNNMFAPTDSLTRAEAAKIIYTALIDNFTNE